MPLLVWRCFLGPSGIVRINAFNWRMPLWAERDCSNRRAHLENASMGGAGLYKSTRSSGIAWIDALIWRMPLWAERDCSNRRAHLENAAMGRAGLFESTRSFGECHFGLSVVNWTEPLSWRCLFGLSVVIWTNPLSWRCLFGLGVVVRTDAPLESPLWARYGRSDQCTFGSCLFGLVLLARDKLRNLLLLLMDQMRLRSGFLAIGIIVLPCDRRIFHFSEKGLPIDEGILRLSLLGNFSSLIGERIFRPSSRRRDISSIPLEGSFVPVSFLLGHSSTCSFRGRGRFVNSSAVWILNVPLEGSIGLSTLWSSCSDLLIEGSICPSSSHLCFPVVPLRRGRSVGQLFSCVCLTMLLQRGRSVCQLFSFVGLINALSEGDHLSERDRSIGEGPSVCQLSGLIDLRSPINGIDRSDVDRSIHQPCSSVDSLGIGLLEADRSVRQLHCLADSGSLGSVGLRQLVLLAP
ncbi:uncharacterized protein G2W53_021506 [Senna tora]|uniref:Uncharacterized protein n=1 Tax=Senna tora TaxID=362788 RepID=A0A834TJI1_9FABA|nr:uncharacterized protein G2W53_021506 [Senna tora]